MGESEAGAIYCARHKETPTGLRCGRCETPVCPQCMVHGPVGVRCPDCGKPPKLPQYEVSTLLVLRAIGASLVIGLAGGFVLLFVIGFGLFYLLAAAALGYALAEGTSYAANRKRGPKLAIVAAIGAIVGHVPIIALLGVVTIFVILGAILAAVVAFVRLRQP